MENFDKLYNDIISNVLPKIQEGLVITKDYAFDLFERYINYLFIKDIISLIFIIILFIIIIYFIPILNKKRKEYNYETLDDGFGNVLFGVYFILPIILFIFLFTSIENIIKDLYIPEVRIYEHINNSINKK